MWNNGKECFLSIGIMAILSGCGQGDRSAGRQPERPDMVQAEDFHADNDIAMTVRSIADAIRVGEPLDTADYNFEGVLTDGEGRPLYTDIQGLPGMWDVDVLSGTSAVIRNHDVGDLLPEDLERYIASSLGLTEEDILSDDVSVLDDDDEAERVVYDFGGGYLRIDTRASMASNGLEGPLVTIMASKSKPTL